MWKSPFLRSPPYVNIAWQKTEYDDYADTMLLEGIEAVHPRHAISWRNNWMLQQSDYIVTYITHDYGGAAQYAKKARVHGRYVINLNDSPSALSKKS